MRRIFLIAFAAAATCSCGTMNRATRGELYAQMYEERPVTLLIMPPVNYSTNVDAKEFLYTSISRPLAEAGYYVISPLLAMEIFKAESAYDSELFIDGPYTKFQEFFGADALVFSEIKSWTKSGFGIQTEIRYFIKSAYTGETLFDRSCNLYLDLSINSGGGSALSLLVDLAASALNTAATDHIIAARKANYYIFSDIPKGKYSPEYMKDQDVLAEPKDITANVN